MNTEKKILLIEKDEPARLLLSAIIRSVDQDIALHRVESLQDARSYLLAGNSISIVILGMNSVGGRARTGFLEFVGKKFPQIQLLLVRSTKNVKSRKKASKGKQEKISAKYISLYLDFDQCRKLIERLLNRS